MIDQPLESLEDFRKRARSWIEQNLERRGVATRDGIDRERERDLQAKIYDAGFSGLAVPVEYGGVGLTLEHHRVWAEETEAYHTPAGFMVSIGMMMPTLLDHGTEAVKKRHIPRMLRGDEVWIQLLSEPSGGSDMAGALTRATPQGDSYILNGSKMWSSGADWADYGICLARTNWDVPKHAGLSMLAVPLKAKGVTINPIVPATGGPAHQFTEFFDNVEIPKEYLLGGEGEGWTVAQRLLFHERNAVAGVSYGSGMGGGQSEEHSMWRLNLREVARRHGALADPTLANQIADDYVEMLVGIQLSARINTGLGTGKLQGHWGSLSSLGLGIDGPDNAELALAVSGADGVIWSDGEEGGQVGLHWLFVRGNSIAGGSNEIQRNIVSERLIGMPREPGDDKTVPFNELMKRRKERS